MDILNSAIVVAYGLVLTGLVDNYKAIKAGAPDWDIRVLSWAAGIAIMAYLKASGLVDVEWAWVVPYGLSLALGGNAAFKAGKALTR